MALRMLDYYVALKRQYSDATIHQALVVLKETGEQIPDRYEGDGWHFPFNVVKMWEEDAQELMKHEGLMWMSTLCGTLEESEKHLKEVASKVIEIKDRAEQREALRMAQVFAGLRFNHKMVYEMLRGTDMLEESSVVQDWLRIGRKQGKQEGLKQGLEKGKQEGLEKGKQEGLEQGLERGEKQIVLKLLTRKIGKLSTKTRNQIESLSLKQVEKLGEALLDFETKTDLNQWLAKNCR